MKRLISLAFITGTLVGCVVPVPINTAAAPYPSYTPAYMPQVPQSSTPNTPVLTTTKAVPVNLPKPIPAAYNTTPPAVVPVAKPQVATRHTANTTTMVPVLSPVNSNQPNRPTPAGPIAHTAGNKTQDLNWLAQRIFKNQTGGNATQLVQWNKQENFAVLGIGEFIWYPAGKSGRYNETFPAYLNYVKANSVPLPAWLTQRPARGGPWPNATAFQKAQNDVQMKELRSFMQKTLNLQANFMAGRLKHMMPKLLNQLHPNNRQQATNSYQAVLKSPGGLYPLLDYVQFKGDGSNPAERYNGKGWGLLHVLQAMEQVQPGPAALAEFMRAADDTLVTRIANAPADRREARLLDDWLKRVNTYRPVQQASR